VASREMTFYEKLKKILSRAIADFKNYLLFIKQANIFIDQIQKPNQLNLLPHKKCLFPGKLNEMESLLI
jgi:hypothetical protein